MMIYILSYHVVPCIIFFLKKEKVTYSHTPPQTGQQPEKTQKEASKGAPPEEAALSWAAE
jgi:hypothetical protein